MTGIVKAIIPPTHVLDDAKALRMKGNYGFILDDAGYDRFFHANDVRGAAFADLEIGERVEFDPIDLPSGGKANGRRAERVRLID